MTTEQIINKLFDNYQAAKTDGERETALKMMAYYMNTVSENSGISAEQFQAMILVNMCL